MKQDYNSRQRKIYHDYSGHSTDSLLEMVKNSGKYLSDVIDVVTDLLVERNVMFPKTEQIPIRGSEMDFSLDKERIKKEETVKSFVKKMNEKSNSELLDIVTRYINFKPETVEAALILSVDKGLISFDVKEKLLSQINANFAAHEKKIKQYKWENNNAFALFVSRYSDEEIYNIIEDPSYIVIDVYHAVILTARERELISVEDFDRLYKDAKLALRTEYEVEKAEIDAFFTPENAEDVFESEEELEAEKEQYWKCPSCGELVNMELGVCWNCQGEIPEKIEHPDTKEIIKQKTVEKMANPVRSGLIGIGGGLLVGLAGLEKNYWGHYHYGRFVFGAIFVLFGIGFLAFGLFFNKEKE